MQVILLEDVKALGKRGSVVKVTDGYARNFLFPKKLAVEATEGNVKNLKHSDAVQKTKKSREVEHARELAAALQANPVQVPARAGDKGKLYGAVTNVDVAQALEKVIGLPIDKRKVTLKEPIKKLGVYTVKVRLHTEVAPEVKIEVVASETSPAAHS